MDFKNAKELLALCQEKKLSISEVMRQREILLGETTAEIVDQRMDRVLEIMKDAAFSPIKDPVISMGGLIGGEARRLCEFHDLGKSLCGDVLGKGITYADSVHRKSKNIASVPEKTGFFALFPVHWTVHWLFQEDQW